MAKPIFNAKINLSSSIGLINPDEFQVDFSVLDIEGVFSGLDVAIDDYLYLDTSGVEAGTISRYKVLSVDTPGFLSVIATVKFIDNNLSIIDPSVAIGVDGFISRPTIGKHLSIVPSFGTQLLPDKFAIYPLNYNNNESLDQKLRLEYRTLTGGEITAKQLTLAFTPASAVIFDVITGVAQQETVDFSVTGNIISWSGLALDGVLTAGDVLRLQYTA
jgi:hypothetical protein